MTKEKYLEQKKLIIADINQCVSLYSKLSGKTLLICFEGNYIEVTFLSRCFKHLTGVSSSVPAKSFYKKAKNKKLKAEQICFSEKHPYTTCIQKIKLLKKIDTFFSKELLLVEDGQAKNYFFKIGCTDLKSTICFTENRDTEGNLVNNLLIPSSIRTKDDSFDISKNQYEIDFIFSKNNSDKKYSEIVFGDKNKIEALKHSITDMLDLL